MRQVGVSKPVLLWSSVLAGLQVFSGGAVLSDLFDPRWVGLMVLAVASLQAGTLFYQRKASEKPVEGL